MTGRRSYNALTSRWYERHPQLMAMRRLAGLEPLTDDEHAAYAADQVPVAESPEDSESVTDYADRRGK